jgi:hypothetical protein
VQDIKKVQEIKGCAIMPYSWRKPKGAGFGVAGTADDLISDKGFFR